MNRDSEIDDAAFATDMVGRLPTTGVPPALEARILADFDRLAVVRQYGALWRLAATWRDRLWPSAPVWQPAMLLAVSLAVGLFAGALVPSSTLTASATVNTDQTLSAMDTSSPAVDLYKDL